VSYPQGTHPAQVFAFLRKHANWLERKLDELQDNAALPPPLKPGVPTVLPLRGETTRLQWRDGAYPHIELADERLILSLPKPHNKQTLTAARGLLHSYLQAQIRRDVSRHLARYTPELGRAPSGIRVKPLKSLWGSLDTRDRVTLDLALALAPPEALRYVVVHELCHLRVRNHSPRFWDLVGSLDPDWKIQRDWLKASGQALKAELARLIAP
jgi:predicted metal-dependent hydrolase